MLVSFAGVGKLAFEAENELEREALRAVCSYIADHGLQLRLFAEDPTGESDDDDGDALND